MGFVKSRFRLGTWAVKSMFFSDWSVIFLVHRLKNMLFLHSSYSPSPKSPGLSHYQQANTLSTGLHTIYYALLHGSHSLSRHEIQS